MNHQTLSVAGLLFLAACATAGAASSAGTAIGDSVITTKIKSSLVADPTTKAREIAVQAHGNIVELSGHVDSADAKQRAQQIASETRGVAESRHRACRHHGGPEAR
jgi:osmotically-inducible protein OsmY